LLGKLLKQKPYDNQRVETNALSEPQVGKGPRWTLRCGFRGCPSLRKARVETISRQGKFEQGD
jgi:hypothetical protein